MATIILLKKEDCYCDLTTFYVNVSKKVCRRLEERI